MIIIYRDLSLPPPPLPGMSLLCGGEIGMWGRGNRVMVCDAYLTGPAISSVGLVLRGMMKSFRNGLLLLQGQFKTAAMVVHAYLA